ncbi:MAG: universal stress protein [Elusimicrobia bacterium]|nr:universal stress protein [Elusimicrobiota bacterium]
MFRFPPRRILVPMDSSGESAAAWQQARQLRRQVGARLEVFYVRWWPPMPVEGMGMHTEWAVRDHEKISRWIRERIGPDTAYTEIDGDPGPQIARMAEHGDFDWIVMGTHGRHGAARVLEGSVAEYVARHAAIPVLVVHKPHQRFRSVLAPVDFDAHAFAGLEAAARVADGLGGTLCVFSVLESKLAPTAQKMTDVRELQRDLISRLAPRPDASPLIAKIAVGDRIREILVEAGRHDLVVVVSHIRRPLRDRLVGTTAERVLRDSPVPVLVVPLEQAALLTAGNGR